MSTAIAHKILMVDDEPNVLSGYQRTVGRIHALTIAEGGAAGLAVMAANGPFSVVITDMRMPSMSGLEFVDAARRASKETVFMMLTGNADQKTAVDAINRGQIFRFLSKPCDAAELDANIRAGIRQYELITAERVLLRETVAGSIKLLMDALELTSPVLAAFQSAVKQIQKDVCARLGIACDWQMTVAGSLCLIGLVTLPRENSSETVSDKSLEQCAELGHRLISNLPRLGVVAAIILHQRDPGMLPADLKSLSPQDIETTGARLLRFSVDLVRAERRLKSRALGVHQLIAMKVYDPRLISAMQANDAAVGAIEAEVREMSIRQLKVGMEIDADICRADGTLVLAHGQRISELSLTTLHHLANLGVIKKAVKIIGRKDAAVPDGQIPSRAA